jgi:RHS repeat-associated protein
VFAQALTITRAGTRTCADARTRETLSIVRAYALTISNDRFARGHHVAMNTARNNAVSASFTRRNLPPRCSRISHSRPIASKTVPRTVFDAIVYDQFGRITSKTQVTTGATNPNRVVTYQYSANGQLRSMTTPSGQTIAYTYGSPTGPNPGKITAIMLNPTGYTATSNGGNLPTGGVNVLTNSDYKPFGPNEGWDWGNSCDTSNATTCTTTSTPRINQHLRQFDLDYRPITIASDPDGYNRHINWDRANRITAITIPSGITVPGIVNANSLNQAFAYDQLDRLTQFNAGIANATTLATGMALLPNEQFTYDAIGNRLSRTTTAPGTTTNQTANYSYPNTSATPINSRRHVLNGIAGAQVNAYTYDASGNTLTESAAQSTMNPATGQLNPLATTQPLTYTYDAKNRLSKAQIGANAADAVTYKINAMGQRVQKVGSGLYAYSTTATIDAATGNSPQSRNLNFNARYVYDEQARLIGEYAPDGKLISETVWFNDLPIATLRPKGANAGTPLGQTGTTTGNPANGATAANANNVGNNTTTNRVNVEVFYVHADHLGTPRTVTRSTVATGPNAPSSATATSPGAINKAVWRWDSDPFGTSLGNSQPTENPQLIAGTATQIQAATFRVNSRFPGQVSNAETGSSYNYLRDGYMPMVGRYSQSDPIGLNGGINTFGYVGGNPIKRIDPSGLVFFGGIGAQCSAAAIFGAGVSGGAVWDSSGRRCTVLQICAKVGLGGFIGCDGQVLGGYTRGSLCDSGGFSIGVGADAGAGLSLGGGGAIQIDEGGGGGGNGGVGPGVGFGLFGGLDFCWTIVTNCDKPCNSCEKK